MANERKEPKPETVRIHNKDYETVASRLARFRYKFPMWGIETEIISINDQELVMKATIRSDDGALIATGYAEEKRNASSINKTSALENGETSAIGRALAMAGYSMGGSISSADEVRNAISQQENSGNQSSRSSRNPEDWKKSIWDQGGSKKWTVLFVHIEGTEEDIEKEGFGSKIQAEAWADQWMDGEK